MIRKLNKYGAKKVKLDGYTFDSKAESARYVELRRMRAAGEICGLDVHPVFEFRLAADRPIVMGNGHVAKFTPDFRYIKMDGGGVVVEDVKGVIVRDYPLRRALFEALYYPLKVTEIGGQEKKKRFDEGWLLRRGGKKAPAHLARKKGVTG